MPLNKNLNTTPQGRPIFQWELPNGLPCILMQTRSPIAHMGLMINAGSRHETPETEGIAHFLEHMLFKGTHKRSAYHINSRLDEVGGDLNAYTTKENIFIYATCLLNHLHRASELIADMAINSRIAQKDIDKEREVILDEIRSCKDDPADELTEQFDQIVFGNHPLAHPILGFEHTLQGIQKKQLDLFYHENMNAHRTILCMVANIQEHEAKKLTIKYFENLKTGTAQPQINQALHYSASQKILTKPSLNNAHLIIGKPAYNLLSPLRLPFFLLNNVLGGPAMNSRLNLNIRDKYGIAYTIESGYQTYTDQALWSVYLATEPNQLHRANELVHKELRKLRESPLGSLQIHKAKNQLKGQLALANENTAGLLHVMARSIQTFGKLERLNDVFLKIDQISATQLCELANDIFNPNELSTLAFTPN